MSDNDETATAPAAQPEQLVVAEEQPVPANSRENDASEPALEKPVLEEDYVVFARQEPEDEKKEAVGLPPRVESSLTQKSIDKYGSVKIKPLISMPKPRLNFDLDQEERSIVARAQDLSQEEVLVLL